MQPREAKLYDEAAALWREVRHEPPPTGLDGVALLSLLLEQTRELDYERLTSPLLRETNLTRPIRTPDTGRRA